MYNVDSLKLGIEKAKDNIKMFEGAIQKERDTIEEYLGYIETLKKKESNEKDSESRVEIIRE